MNLYIPNSSLEGADGCTDSMQLQDNMNNVSSVAEQHPFSSQDESFQEVTLFATFVETLI